jgi:hypothetical protein
MHLASLYTVIIGVSLSSSIYQLIDPAKGITSISLPSFLSFLGFVFLVFPFYHGAMRHLDSTYMNGAGAQIRDYALLADFLLLFAHGVLFVVVSMLLKQPREFLLFIAGVLAVDVFWGFLAHLAFSRERVDKPETAWAWINLITVIVLIMFYYLEKQTFKWLPDEEVGYCGTILAVLFVRSLVDYKLNWKFYYPPQKVRRKKILNR